MYAQDRLVGLGAYEEPRRHQHLIVDGIGIHVFDAVDRLDQRFQGLRDELDPVLPRP